MADTSIQWTDKSWNPIRGCSIVSEGCRSCYAMRQAHRFSGKGKAYEGLTVLGKHGPRWSGRAVFVPEMLDAPLRWKRPRRVFVNSMSDLFHEDVTVEQIAAVLGVMSLACHHTYQVLTKRPERMLAIMSQLTLDDCINATLDDVPPLTRAQSRAIRDALPPGSPFAHPSNGELWPLPNVWLGTSCEDQQRADERVPLLMECPAAIRFVSAEPLLGPINLRPWLGTECTHEDAHVEPDTNAVICRACDEADQLDWVIVGGESGPGARPCQVQWIRSIVQQCAGAGVSCFNKQLGARPIAPAGEEQTAWGQYVRWNEYAAEGQPTEFRTDDKKGGDMEDWAPDLRVRQFPEVGR